MKICVIGAPSTGKSVFAKNLAAYMSKEGLSCELVQEYASEYIQAVGAPEDAWEQLVISIGQYLAEREAKRDHMVTDAAMFVTYLYAQRLLPEQVGENEWPKYRNLIDMLRVLARQSVESYDAIFVMSHIFEPRADGVRLSYHLTRAQCEAVQKDIVGYLKSERAKFTEVDGRDPLAVQNAFLLLQERLDAVS